MLILNKGYIYKLIDKRASESPLFLCLKFKAENANKSRVFIVVDIFIELKRFAVLVAATPFKRLLNIYKFFCPPLYIYFYYLSFIIYLLFYFLFKKSTIYYFNYYYNNNNI